MVAVLLPTGREAEVNASARYKLAAVQAARSSPCCTFIVLVESAVSKVRGSRIHAVVWHPRPCDPVTLASSQIKCNTFQEVALI